MNRREFTRLALAGLGIEAFSLPASETSGYVRANTDWLAKCRYGIGVHWTAQTVPLRGDPLSFEQAVDAFKLKAFVEQVRYAGADYVLFTAAHALQMLPAPHPVIDRLSLGRTCRRDLIGELADALAVHGMPLLVYWNHSCNGRDDPEWRKAVGYDGKDKGILAKNLLDIVAWMGGRYGEKIKAWWFDSSYSLDSRGPHNSVTTDMTGFQFPWERFTAAAKTGFPNRLVTYNAGVAQTFLYTAHQDYWAGELVNLKTPATSRFLSNGLQWFGWTCMDWRGWVHTKRNAEIPKPLYADSDLVAYVRACNEHQAPMTFNVGIYQDGTMAPASVEQLRRLGTDLRR
ncbi:MAG: alpha-L-fucosidase [Verrucomicrobia bacterium]|nr:alpha-L-fucosidase [Verrucomicrobiota bacterium]